MKDEMINLHWPKFYGWFGAGVVALIAGDVARLMLPDGPVIGAALLVAFALSLLLAFVWAANRGDEFERDVASRGHTSAGLMAVLLASAAPVVAAFGFEGFGNAYNALALPGLFILFSLVTAQYQRWVIARPEKELSE